MILSRKLTGALAWGGLILILGVPSAEMLSAKVGTDPAAPAKADPVQTASVAAPTGDAVADFAATGQPMPDYISGPATTPRRTLPATGTVTPAAAPKPAGTPALPQTQIAAVPESAPIPMPARMRPLPPAQPTQTAATQPVMQQPAAAPAAIPAPAPVVVDQNGVFTREATAQRAPASAPVVLDETTVIAREASTQPAIIPPADIPEPPRVVSEDELQDWDSGSLADYLQRRGLMSDASAGQPSQSAATVNDNDGFYLNDRPRRRARSSEDDGSFVVFPND
jgi:hypothetical protein